MNEIREIKDLNLLMRWRCEVIEQVFDKVPTQELLDNNEEYYRKHIAKGDHYAVEALNHGEEAGCGGICFTEELPSPDNPSGRCAYLMNIYVRDRFRTHGIGHFIVRHLIDVAKKRNCGKIYLETTPIGRSLYESLGFRDLPDILKLKVGNHDTGN